MVELPRTGPLVGVRVLEVGGMGPGPFAGMALSDMGADVIRVERPGGAGVFPGDPRNDVLNRGKRSICLDLKVDAGRAALLELAARSDVLIEGYRPGVAERLGIGPDVCLELNPKLIYGRMTGWGQTGPLALTAGHDIDYIAVTGALHAIGSAGGPPQIPVNLVGDFGGGGTYLVIGVLAGLLEAGRTGRGQVVDAAIVDGVSHLLAATHAQLNAGEWLDERGVNSLDGGSPYYAVYETADGRHMAIGAVEQKFYAQALDVLGVDVDPREQHQRSTWASTKQAIADAFASRSQAEWIKMFDGLDACIAPIVSIREAANHPQISARRAVIAHGDFIEPGIAPRFSLHADVVPPRPVTPGLHTVEVLSEVGLDAAELMSSGAAFGVDE